MTLVALQARRHGTADVEQFKTGFYHFGLPLIERDCVDPELSPEVVAMSLACSRPSLYRAFFRHGQEWPR